MNNKPYRMLYNYKIKSLSQFYARKIFIKAFESFRKIFFNTEEKEKEGKKKKIIIIFKTRE